MASSISSSSTAKVSTTISSLTDSSRSSRRLSGFSPERPHQEPCRLGSRRKMYCTQWNLPRELMCGGCRQYLLSTEGKPPSGKARAETHSSDRYECKQPWKTVSDDGTAVAEGGDEGNYKFIAAESWGTSVVEWIKTNEHCNLARVTGTPKSATHSVTK